MRILLNAVMVSEPKGAQARIFSNLPQELLKFHQDMLIYSPILRKFKLLQGRADIARVVYLLWLNTFLPYQVRRYHVDIVLNIFGFGGFLIPVPQVTIVHGTAPELDLEPSLHLHYLYGKFVNPIWLRRSGAIIALSESQRRDLVKYWRIPPRKAFVIYWGCDHSHFRPIPNASGIVERRYGLKNYFISIGAGPRKNPYRLLEAFARIAVETSCSLVIIPGIGKPEAYIHLKQKIKELGIENKVSVLRYIPDEDMPILYSGAKALVFPSLYESFGLPPLEAMACGTPVITSNISSLPEVVGDAAILVNPYSVEEIAQAMKEVAINERLRQELMRKSLERAKLFTWEKTAKGILEVIYKVAEAKGIK